MTEVALGTGSHVMGHTTLLCLLAGERIATVETLQNMNGPQQLCWHGEHEKCLKHHTPGSVLI